MKIIKEIVIDHFKGIEKLNFPCGSINVIVGQNNTGKSSILQSIWLSITSLNNFTDVIGTNLSDIIGDKSNIKYLINQGKEKSCIKLNMYDNSNINLDLVYSNKKIPNDLLDYFSNFVSDLNYLDSELPLKRDVDYRLLRELQRATRFYNSEDSKDKIKDVLRKTTDQIDSEMQKYRTEIFESEKLFIVSKLNNIILSIYMINDMLEAEIYKSDKVVPISDIPLLFSSPKIQEETLLLYQKLFKTKKLPYVLENLKTKISYLEDIAIIDDEIFVSLKNIDRPLPLSSMGDGFKALLKLSFMAPLIKNGIILFEEPETSMHPGYSEVLAEEIISNSSDSQFFLTTHSSELIEYLLKKADKSGKINSIKIFRLSRLSGGFIEREIYSGNDANEVMEDIKIDLRGY